MSESAPEWSVRDFRVLHDVTAMMSPNDASREMFGNEVTDFKNRDLYLRLIRDYALMYEVRKRMPKYVDVETANSMLNSMCRTVIRIAKGTEMENVYLRYMHATVLFMLSVLHASQ